MPNQRIDKAGMSVGQLLERRTTRLEREVEQGEIASRATDQPKLRRERFAGGCAIASGAGGGAGGDAGPPLRLPCGAAPPPPGGPANQGAAGASSPADLAPGQSGR